MTLRWPFNSKSRPHSHRAAVRCPPHSGLPKLSHSLFTVDLLGRPIFCPKEIGEIALRIAAMDGAIRGIALPPSTMSETKVLAIIDMHVSGPERVDRHRARITGKHPAYTGIVARGEIRSAAARMLGNMSGPRYSRPDPQR